VTRDDEDDRHPGKPAESLPLEKPISVRTYVVSLSLWLSLCVTAAGMLVRQDIRDAEGSLKQFGAAYADHLDKKMVSNETILKGFSALFGAVGRTDPEMASRYARQFIETNPQIFSLEIVQAVSKDGLAALVSAKRREGIASFQVKSFSYDGERKWQAPKDKPVYYPIVFMEPIRPGFDDVRGLDIDSVPFLQRAMREAVKRNLAVASHPLHLVEGNLAYVVFAPIAGSYFRADALPSAEARFLVDMVVDAGNLTDEAQFPVFDGGTISVYHADFPADEPKGQLRSATGAVRSPLEIALFPRFVFQHSLAPQGAPFALIVTRQIGWSDLSRWPLALITLVTVLSSLLLLAYLRAQQRGRIVQREHQQRLWQLANHDGLTGLPNRMLLMDRLQQALARMSRQGDKAAVMFLDIDRFKQVNDTYGHAAGDQLLQVVAERLRSAVRAGDTVARICGDEFVIVIENLESRAALDVVCEKIAQALRTVAPLESVPPSLGISLGIAIFPEDGETAEVLLRKADDRMYEDKARHRFGG
jgi:diguanylate cyclase (GGDEF)-like protein